MILWERLDRIEQLLKGKGPPNHTERGVGP
jgi:hypothetical protein